MNTTFLGLFISLFFSLTRATEPFPFGPFGPGDWTGEAVRTPGTIILPHGGCQVGTYITDSGCRSCSELERLCDRVKTRGKEIICSKPSHNLYNCRFEICEHWDQASCSHAITTRDDIVLKNKDLF